MTHYVFLKFPAGYCAGELLDKMEGVLIQAQDTMLGFEHHQILTESDVSGALLSALIILQFASTTAKDNYLQHPLHLALLQQVKPIITGRAVFDSEK